MILNKVWALGKDTYIRFYPNPGIGFNKGDVRFAISLYGGFEKFKRRTNKDPWYRTHALLTRVKRPTIGAIRKTGR
jgi:hypothetical protein